MSVYLMFYLSTKRNTFIKSIINERNNKKKKFLGVVYIYYSQVMF